MVPRRHQFHQLLKDTVGEGVKVYFQPPSNEKMVYPCVLYRRDRVNTTHADNSPYRTQKRYAVTVIDRDPDSELPDKIAQLPSASFSRFYLADNLNHDVYTIYF